MSSEPFLNYLKIILVSDRSRVEADRGSRRASSRGIIPRAKIKTVKMTIVIVIGNFTLFIFTIIFVVFKFLLLQYSYFVGHRI